MACRRRYRRWIDASLRRGMSARVWRRLRPHLDECPACRHRLERVLLVSRALTPNSPIGSLEIDVIGRGVLDREPSRQPRSWWFVGGSAVAAAGVASLFLLFRSPTDGLQPRGHAPTFNRPPGARVFCVDRPDTDVARVTADARATELALPIPRLRCRMTDRLQIAYSTPSLEGITMVAFARTSDEVFWYAPRRPSETSVPLVSDAIQHALEWSTRLDVNHAPGLYDVRVLFFDHPVIAEDAAAGRAPPIQTLALELEIVNEGAP